MFKRILWVVWLFSFWENDPFFSLTNIFEWPARSAGSFSKSIDCNIHARNFFFFRILPLLKEREKKVIFVRGGVPEQSRLTCPQTWTTWGAVLSALIHAKPRKNKMGIGATRSPAGVDVSAVTLQTLTGSCSATDRHNLWKWKCWEGRGMIIVCPIQQSGETLQGWI